MISRAVIDRNLAPDDPQSLSWRKDFVETFLLRDLPQYGVRIPATELRRLWMMCAHLHGKLLNVSELGQSLDRSRTAIAVSSGRRMNFLPMGSKIMSLPWRYTAKPSASNPHSSSPPTPDSTSF